MWVVRNDHLPLLKLKVMKIELVKEYNRQGQVSYYVKVNDEIYPQSINIELAPTLVMFDIIRAKYTQARVEVLLVEEI